MKCSPVLGMRWCRAGGTGAGRIGRSAAGGGYAIRMLGYKDFVFAVAPDHPLARLPEPLKHEQILAHRAVAIGDSSRNLPPRSVGLLTGQDALTVPDLESKVAAQAAGLGCGYLPTHAAAALIKAKRLVIKAVEKLRRGQSLLRLALARERQGAALVSQAPGDQDVRASLLRY